ncbi:hypothetical protein FQA39_LY04977 [Lamprigera yunnana]|nr:hypothetical protein FQA39_LY04977 [Lamprigera yunnana]
MNKVFIVYFIVLNIIVISSKKQNSTDDEYKNELQTIFSTLFVTDISVNDTNALEKLQVHISTMLEEVKTVSSRRGARKLLLSKGEHVESSEDRGASVGIVKSASTIYLLSLYLLKFPVLNLPLTQVINEAVNKETVTTKGCPKFMNRFKADVGGLITIRIAGSLVMSG